MPFLTEASKNYDPHDNEDRIVTDNLKRLIRSFIWYVFLAGIGILFLTFYVIPLHSENQVLKMELKEEKEERSEIERRFNAHQVESDKRATNMQKLTTQLEYVQGELRNTRMLYGECREENVQYRITIGKAGEEYFRDKNSKVKPPAHKEGEPNPPKSPTSKVASPMKPVPPSTVLKRSNNNTNEALDKDTLDKINELK